MPPRATFLLTLALCFQPGIAAENLLRNGGFEDGLAPWHQRTPAAALRGFAVVPDAAHSGAVGLLMENHAPTLTRLRQGQDQDLRIAAGSTILYTVWARCALAGGAAMARFYCKWGTRLGSVPPVPPQPRARGRAPVPQKHDWRGQAPFSEPEAVIYRRLCELPNLHCVLDFDGNTSATNNKLGILPGTAHADNDLLGLRLQDVVNARLRGRFILRQADEETVSPDLIARV